MSIICLLLNITEIIIMMLYTEKGGRNSSDGIATRYGLDGPEIESQWERDFPPPSRPALGPTSLLYNGYQVFPGGKAAGAWC